MCKSALSRQHLLQAAIPTLPSEATVNLNYQMKLNDIEQTNLQTELVKDTNSEFIYRKNVKEMKTESRRKCSGWVNYRDNVLKTEPPNQKYKRGRNC